MSLELPCDLDFVTIKTILNNYDVRIEDNCKHISSDNETQYIFLVCENNIIVECYPHCCEDCFDGQLCSYHCGGLCFSVYRVDHKLETCELGESNGTLSVEGGRQQAL